MVCGRGACAGVIWFGGVGGVVLFVVGRMRKCVRTRAIREGKIQPFLTNDGYGYIRQSNESKVAAWLAAVKKKRRANNTQRSSHFRGLQTGVQILG